MTLFDGEETGAFMAFAAKVTTSIGGFRLHAWWVSGVARPARRKHDGPGTVQ
jgi:hypothetical protein